MLLVRRVAKPKRYSGSGLLFPVLANQPHHDSCKRIKKSNLSVPNTPGLTPAPAQFVSWLAGPSFLSLPSFKHFLGRLEPAWYGMRRSDLPTDCEGGQPCYFSDSEATGQGPRHRIKWQQEVGVGTRKGVLIHWDSTAILVGWFLPPEQVGLGVGSKEESPFSFHIFFIRSSPSPSAHCGRQVHRAGIQGTGEYP